MRCVNRCLSRLGSGWAGCSIFPWAPTQELNHQDIPKERERTREKQKQYSLSSFEYARKPLHLLQGPASMAAREAPINQVPLKELKHVCEGAWTGRTGLHTCFHSWSLGSVGKLAAENVMLATAQWT